MRTATQCGVTLQVGEVRSAGMSSTAAWRSYLPSWAGLKTPLADPGSQGQEQADLEGGKEAEEGWHGDEAFEDEEASGRALSRYRNLSSFEMRSRLKDAVCRIEGRGVHGSGFLIEYRGMVGILTVSSLVPDKDTARTCAAIFHTAKGERVQVALLPESLFFTSPERSKGVSLDYTFVACEDCGPHIRALVLQRSRAPTVAAGDSVHIMLRDEAGETALSESRVVRVKSPFVFYYAFDAQNITTAAGTLVINGYEPIALHRHRCPATVTVSDSLISALACAPPRNPSSLQDAGRDYDTGPRKKGILISAIIDNLVGMMPEAQSTKFKPRKPRPRPKPAPPPTPEVAKTRDRGCSLFGRDTQPPRALFKSFRSAEVIKAKEEMLLREEQLRGFYRKYNPAKEAEAALVLRSSLYPTVDALNHTLREQYGDDLNSFTAHGLEESFLSDRRVDAGSAPARCPPAGGMTSTNRSVKLDIANDVISDGHAESEGLLLKPCEPLEGGALDWHLRQKKSADAAADGLGGEVAPRGWWEGKKEVQDSRLIEPAWAWVAEVGAAYGGGGGGEGHLVDEVGKGVSLRGLRSGSVDGKVDGGEGKLTGEVTVGAGEGDSTVGVGVGLALVAWSPQGLAAVLNKVARTHEAVRVHAMLEGSPAWNAEPSIHCGDIVKSIDKAAVTSLQQAKQLLLGPAGSSVAIELMRHQCVYQVQLVRDDLAQPLPSA